MASVWDFVGGFSESVVDGIKEREKSEAEIKRAKMLDGLRRETFKYEFDLREASDAKKVDKDLSYYDPTTNEFVQKNSKGGEINKVEATAAQKQAHEAGNLDIDYKKMQIANVGIDNARADRALGLQAQGMAEARADRRSRNSLDGGKDGKDGKLYGLAQQVVKDVADLGVSSNDIARVRSDLYGGISTGKYNESDIRRYQATYMGAANKSNVAGLYAKDGENKQLELERIKAKISN